jgi:hypothetical protein
MRAMAYHEVAMWEILTVLERLARRESKTAIARATGHSRSTVRRYEHVARELGWTPEGEAPPDGLEALAAKIGHRLQPGSDRDAGEIEAQLLPQLEQIRQWLTPAPQEQRGLRLTKVHQLLTRHGVVVPYSSLHRFVVKHCAFGARGRVTVRMADVAPGELAETDFGRLGRVWDPGPPVPAARGGGTGTANGRAGAPTAGELPHRRHRLAAELSRGRSGTSGRRTAPGG